MSSMRSGRSRQRHFLATLGSLTGFLAAFLAIGIGISANGLASATELQAGTSSAPSDGNENGLRIWTAAQLPDTYPHSHYSIHFQALRGGSERHWHLEKGALPPGLKLEDNGVLQGEPLRAGEFHFALSVTDSGPQQAVQKEFVLRVVEAITVVWKNAARVNGNRIEGSVEVTNTTTDDVDLTFVVLAVAENGRATAIGYQHFSLPHAVTGMELPFGESLPSGAYVVHVDVVGEVEAKNQIYRQRLETPHPLRVTVGP
jgi:hypothetical protein